jgi:hypothetical protein
MPARGQQVLLVQALLITLLGLVLSGLVVLALALVVGSQHAGSVQAPGRLPSPAPGAPVSVTGSWRS